MGFSEEARKEIIGKLNDRVKMRACTLCQTNSWTLADGFAPLALQEDFAGLTIGGPALPCVALVCNNCGNTYLINLINLGLRDLVDRLQAAHK